VAASKRGETVLHLISPLVGEMPGRAEGGIASRYSDFFFSYEIARGATGRKHG